MRERYTSFPTSPSPSIFFSAINHRCHLAFHSLLPHPTPPFYYCYHLIFHFCPIFLPHCIAFFVFLSSLFGPSPTSFFIHPFSFLLNSCYSFPMLIPSSFPFFPHLHILFFSSFIDLSSLPSLIPSPFITNYTFSISFFLSPPPSLSSYIASSLILTFCHIWISITFFFFLFPPHFHTISFPSSSC